MDKLQCQKLNFVEYQISSVKVQELKNHYLLVGKDKGQIDLIDLKVEQILFTHQFCDLQNIINIQWVNDIQFCVITDQSNLYTFSINNIYDYKCQKIDTAKILCAQFDILNIQESENQIYIEQETSFNSDLESEDNNIQNLNGVYMCLGLESGEVKIYKSELNNITPYFNFINTISNMTNRNSQIGSVSLDAKQGYILIGYKNGQIKKNEIHKNGNNIWTLDTIEKSITKLIVFNEQFCIAGQQDGSVLMIQVQYGALIQDIKLDDCQLLSLLKNDQHLYISCSNQRIYHFLFNEKEQQFQQVAKNLTEQAIINNMLIYKQDKKDWLITGGLKQDLVKHSLKDNYLQKQQNQIIQDTLLQQNFVFYSDNNIIGYYYLNNISLLKLEDNSQTVIFRLKTYDSYLSISYNHEQQILVGQTKKQLRFYNTQKGKLVKILDNQYQNIIFLRNKLICYDSANSLIVYLDLQQNYKCIKKIQVDGIARSPLIFQLSFNKTYLLIGSLLEKKLSLFKISNGEVVDLDFLVENKITKFISFYQKQDNIFLLQNKIRVYDVFEKQLYAVNLKTNLPLLRNVLNFVFCQDDKFKGILYTKKTMIKFQLKKNGNFATQNLQEEPVSVQWINQNLLLYLYIDRSIQMRNHFQNTKTVLSLKSQLNQQYYFQLQLNFFNLKQISNDSKKL